MSCRKVKRGTFEWLGLLLYGVVISGGCSSNSHGLSPSGGAGGRTGGAGVSGGASGVGGWGGGSDAVNGGHGGTSNGQGGGGHLGAAGVGGARLDTGGTAGSLTGEGGGGGSSGVGGQGGHPPGTTLVRSVSVGFGGACALLATGAVECWGEGSYGSLADGSTGETSRPGKIVEVSSVGTMVQAIAAAQFTACAITSAGTLLCWGQNQNQQLAIDPTLEGSSTPVQVNGWLDRPTIAVALGERHGCAVSSTGDVACWGDNRSYQGGATSPSFLSTATPVQGLAARALSVAVTLESSCALLETGRVQCWGRNEVGQLGNGGNQVSPSASATPLDVVALDGVTQIAAAKDTLCAVANGGVKCWGLSEFDTLGASEGDTWVPIAISGLASGVAAITGGGETFCALLEAGTVECWGLDNVGQVGDEPATTSVTGSVPIPTVVKDLPSAVSVSVGGDNGEEVCAALAAGGIKCWGEVVHSETSLTMLSTVPQWIMGF